MIGTVIGNFRIVAQLGKGGMGEVWLAEQQSIKTKVAIKLLRGDVSADVSHVQRFFNEAVAVSKIRHAGIVRIFDVGFLETRAYLVMELLEGETLARRISRGGRLSLREVCDVGRQVAGVLDATHVAGIIHRDLKPENVFLVPDAELSSGERAKVLDFGIAKLGSVGMTSTSVGSMGTPLYMSPEQWRNVAKVDGRTDAYSLGCVVFESACGRPPFPATSMGEACAMHLTEPPPAPSSVVPGLPPAFDQIVLGLLAKEPASRPSMKEVMAALDAIAQGLPAAVPFASGTHGAASPLLSSRPVAVGAATVGTVGSMVSPAVALTATATTGPELAATGPGLAATGPGLGPAGTGPGGGRLAMGAGAERAATELAPELRLERAATELAPEPGPERAATELAPEPGLGPSPVMVTTLGGSAGPAQAAGPRRGRATGVIARIAAIAIVAGSAATAAVLVVRADQKPSPQPPAPEPAPPAVPEPGSAAGSGDTPAPPPMPPPRADLPFVSPSAVRKLSGEVPKGLPGLVFAQLCINPEGAVTTVQPQLDLEGKLGTLIEEKLKTWSYEPFRRDGKAIAVCFAVKLLPPQPVATPTGGGSKPGSGSGKPAPGGGSGSGAGSGSGKPAPGGGDGSGSGSGKPGSGSGSGSGKPAPGDGSGSGKPAPGPGSGSGKPTPGPGSGSGKPGSGSGSGSGKPTPGPGSGSGGGSGSGKPTPGPGSGSGKPAPGGGSAPPPPPPSIPEQLSRADLPPSRIDSTLKDCRGRARRDAPVLVSFRVAAEGSVQDLKINAAPKAAACISKALKGAKFAPTQRGGGPFEFKLSP